MCLILIAYRAHPDYPLVIAANRDELFERPTQSARFWDDPPSILGGRDLQHGGTWLGMDRRGRLAAVTNYREPSKPKTGVISRGLLVSDFLRGDQSQQGYLSGISANRHHYDGFNLFTYEQDTLCFCSSHLPQPRQLEPGVYGLSNGELDAQWPKVVKGKSEISRILAAPGGLEPEALFALLADKSAVADTDLPDTGVGIEWERLLSTIFINAGKYGTRASTVVLMGADASVNFTERNFDADGELGEVQDYRFSIRDS